MSELPDYEVEIEVQGGRLAVVGYVQVRGQSTREALAEAVRHIEQGTGVWWWDAHDARVRWEDFASPDMDVQIAAITPYGSKWSLRRYAAAVAAARSDAE